MSGSDREFDWAATVRSPASTTNTEAKDQTLKKKPSVCLGGWEPQAQMKMCADQQCKCRSQRSSCRNSRSRWKNAKGMGAECAGSPWFWHSLFRGMLGNTGANRCRAVKVGPQSSRSCFKVAMEQERRAVQGSCLHLPPDGDCTEATRLHPVAFVCCFVLCHFAELSLPSLDYH